MKIKFLLISIVTSVTFYFSSPTWSLTDQQVVQSLEALGEWEAAYPLAYQLAAQQNTYQSWRHLVINYAQFDSNNQAYWHAWQQAYHLNQPAIYRDFLTLRPQSPLKAHVIHLLYQAVYRTHDLADDIQFMEEFPNSVESLQTLLHLQTIAFAKARKADEPAIYDAFIKTFPGAQQIPQAIELALAVEQEMIESLDNQADYTAHEQLARRLYNEARLAEKQGEKWVAARKYQLLSLERFKDTKVLTEILDREERLAYQKLMQIQQAEVIKSLEEMRMAVVETLEVQTQTLAEQGQRLENLFAIHHQKLAKQLEQLEQDSSSKALLTSNLIGISGELVDLVPGVNMVGAIGRIVARAVPLIKIAWRQYRGTRIALF
jgi:hypothetical protein